MFDFLGSGEIALVVIVLVLLFNSRDIAGIVRFVNRQYLRARRYFYRIRAELLYEPPTAEELRRSREAGEQYRRYADAPADGDPPAQQDPSAEKDPSAGG